jgi:hypothetical protein
MPQGGEVGGQVAVDDEYVGLYPRRRRPFDRSIPIAAAALLVAARSADTVPVYLAKLDHRVGVIAVSFDAGDAGVGTRD